VTGWAPRRFYRAATAGPEGAGWTVRLDGRPVRTPAKSPLILPTRALAEAIAGEWAAQDGTIDPASMPLARAANSAIDKVALQRPEVVAMLAGYGETDLLCHRAEAPTELVARQARAWDPLLAWAAEDLGAPLTPVAGVMPVVQPPGSLARLRAALDALDAFELTAAHDLVTLTGSLVVGLAAVRGHQPDDDLWGAATVDDAWQAEIWGHDDEAFRAAEARREAFLSAARFLSLTRARA
jgi:chaperone required for assembly of F1-ATPase